jgi:hypothetical protein
MFSLVNLSYIISSKATSSIHMENMSDGGFLNLQGCQQNGYTTHGMHLRLYCKLQELS